MDVGRVRAGGRGRALLHKRLQFDQFSLDARSKAYSPQGAGRENVAEVTVSAVFVEGG